MSGNTSTSHPMMRALAAGIRANVPTLLWGPPGTTKSATIESHATAWGMHCETIVGSIRDATDFLGLPMEVDGGVRYAPPAWALRLEAAPRGLLFLDELTTCGAATTKAMLRVVQERYVGECKLPDTVAIVAAANPPDVAVGGEELDPPVANRFMHLDWHFAAATWRDGLVGGFDNLILPALNAMTSNGTVEDRAHAVSVVAAFTDHHAGLLNPGVPDGEAASRAFPSPRSWFNVAQVLTYVKRDDLATMNLVVAGLVGEGAAREFLTWYKSAGLYDVAQVMRDPSTVTWRKDAPDVLFALMQAVVAVAKNKGSKAVYEQAFDVCVSAAQGGRRDTVIPALMSLAQTMPDGAFIPATLRDEVTQVLVAA